MTNSESLNVLLLNEKQDLLKRIAAIDMLLGNPSNVDLQTISESHNNDFIKIPAKYDSNLIWDDKCLFIINEMKSGYSLQIFNRVLFYEPQIDKKKASTGVSQALNKLKKAGKIKVVETTGKKLRYAINS